MTPRHLPIIDAGEDETGYAVACITVVSDSAEAYYLYSSYWER